MDIAGKVLQLKQDFDNVYEAGKSEGLTEGYNNGYSEGVEQGYEDGYEVGGKNNQWWLDWFKTKTNINSFFQGSTMTYIPEDIDWSNVITANNALRGCLNIQQEYLYLNTTNATILGYLFYQSNCGLKELTINVSSAEDISGLVGQDCSIKRVNFIGNCNKVKTSTNMAIWGSLEEIHCYTDETMTEEIPLDLSSNTTTTMFYNAPQFKHAMFAPQSIKISMDVGYTSVLDDSTIQSFVDGFADMTGQTAPTLKVNKKVGEKMTDEQKTTLTAKNVILVY